MMAGKERLGIHFRRAKRDAIDVAENFHDPIRRRNLIATATMGPVAMSQQPTRFAR